MKLTILLLTAGLLHASANTAGQTITVSGKNLKLEQVFSIVKEQTGFVVFATMDVLKEAKPVSVEVNQMPVSDFMNLTLRDQGLTYEISNQTILVSKKVIAAADLSPRLSSLFTPPDPIKGVVRDSTGMYLDRATVTNKRTKTSVHTNAKGEFSIEGEEGDELVISFVGFESQNVSITGPFLIATLRASSSPLDEVQIMAYGKTSRRLSTGNIATVKSDVISKQPVDNPLLALQGRVAGLMVSPTSGNPGAGVTLQIRGQNSLIKNVLGPTDADLFYTPNDAPLYVIDGLPFTNSIPAIVGVNRGNTLSMSALSFINPADIESISILKDADATAIYGSRGANGVVLITTKKGRMGVTRVDANVSAGYGEVTRKLDLLNTQQYLEMRKEAYKNDGIDFTAPPYDAPSLQNSMAPDLFVWDQNRYTDWQEILLGGTAKNTSSQVSLSGGSPIIQYLVSGAYNRQSYVYPGEAKYESGSGHFSLTGASPSQTLRVTLTGSYLVNNSVAPPEDFTGLAMALPPNAPALYKENGELNWEPNLVSGRATWQNPFARLHRSNKTNNKSLGSNAEILYKLLPTLTLKTTLGFSQISGETYQPVPMLAFDPVSWSTRIRESQFRNNDSRSWSVEPQLLYTVNIGKGTLEGLTGTSFQSQKLEWESLIARGFGSDALLRNWTAATSFRGSNSSSEYKYTSVFGRVTYNWAARYIINISARRDGSSRFGPNRQFGNFSSIGTAWIFSEESFVENALPFLSFGKAKFSYGKTGNDGIGNYKYLQLYGSSMFGNGTYQGTVPMGSSGVANPYYSWEDVRKLEFSLDLGFFKDHVLISSAWYQNRSSNQIGHFTLPTTAGNSNEFVDNQPAKIENSGLEFTIATSNIKTKNFTWTTSGNISFQKNKLLAVPVTGGYAGDIDTAHIGQPFAGVFYLNQYMGVDPATGFNQFADTEGKPTSDPYASLDVGRQVLTMPEFFGGLSNTFTYKGISLDVFLQFTKQKGVNYLYDPAYAFNRGFFFSAANGISGGNQPAEVMNRWQKPGDRPEFQMFSASNPDLDASFNNAQSSDVAYVDASFIRIKNASVSYTIPQYWKNKIKVQSLRIYVQGQNLWTFTNYKGLDPETQSLSALPQLRVITAGLQIGL